MSKEIPFLSATKINVIDDYERFRHTKAYIKSLSPLPEGSFKLAGEAKKTFFSMMEASGYKHYSKFVIHKKEWDQLIRKIPLGYFNFLGVDRKVLDLTLELDYQEYEDALELPLYPKFATIRLMAAVYASEKIPGNMIEEQALEYIYEVVKEKGFQCCINYPFLKTIFVDKRQGINTIYYPPEIEFTKLYALPRRDGRRIGRSCLA